MREYNKKVRKAIRGWYIWHRLVHNKDISYNTMILMLPTNNNTYNYFSLAHMEEFMHRMGYSNAVVFTIDKNTESIIREIVQNRYKICCLGERKMSDFLAYASIWNYVNTDQRLRIGSLDHPSGRDQCKKLIGVEKIDEEYLISVGVYRLLPFVRRKISVTDERKISDMVKDFLNVPFVEKQ